MTSTVIAEYELKILTAFSAMLSNSCGLACYIKGGSKTDKEAQKASSVCPEDAAGVWQTRWHHVIMQNSIDCVKPLQACLSNHACIASAI